MPAVEPAPIREMSFGSYAAILTATGWAPSGELAAAPPRPPWSIRLGRMMVPRGMRDSVKTALTRAAAPGARRRAAALLATGRDIRLHLGCGPNHLTGWVNLDLVSTGPDIPWDLSRPAPFPEGSIAAIFHEHLLEHLPLPAAISFLSQCRRLLRPGGVLRVGVPDFGRYVRDYVGDRSLIRRVRPRRPTALLALAELTFCYGHASIWDEETLLGALLEVGFSSPRKVGYLESCIEPAPDSSWRSAETLYAEAVR